MMQYIVFSLINTMEDSPLKYIAISVFYFSLSGACVILAFQFFDKAMENVSDYFVFK